jgi:hypothetical protein
MEKCIRLYYLCVPCIYQPPKAHVRDPRILLSNAMAAAGAVEDLLLYTIMMSESQI